MVEHTYCVFEYLYRDAGNFKVFGCLLLEGVFSDVDVVALRRRFESEEFFIAEQLGVPTLYHQLWDECDSEPSDEMDHVWHEFHSVRIASSEDLAAMAVWGKAEDFKTRILGIRQWNESLSINWPV